MDVRNCLRCNKIFRPIGDHRYCSDCVQADRKEFESVREYLKTHANAAMMEISKETGVSPKKIREYIRDGRLVIAGDDTAFQCEGCGEPIQQGRFCPSCARRFKDELRRGLRPDLGGSQGSEHDQGQKSHTWNRFRRW